VTVDIKIPFPYAVNIEMTSYLKEF